MRQYIWLGVLSLLGAAMQALTMLQNDPDTPSRVVIIAGLLTLVSSLLTGLKALFAEPPGKKAEPPTSGSSGGSSSLIAVLFLAGALAGGGVALSACTAAGGSSPGVETPRQRLYALNVATVAATKEAAAYEARPRCGPGSPPLCSDPDAVTALRAAATAARDAMAAAKASPTASNLDALSAALVGLRGVMVGVVNEGGVAQ